MMQGRSSRLFAIVILPLPLGVLFFAPLALSIHDAEAFLQVFCYSYFFHYLGVLFFFLVWR